MIVVLLSTVERSVTDIERLRRVVGVLVEAIRIIPRLNIFGCVVFDLL